MIQINMAMPKNCRECPLFESRYHFHGCHAKPESINDMDMWNCVTSDRPSWCPLIEIPPHGRLIDGDVLNDMINRSYPMTDRFDVHNGYAIVQEMITLLPIIIEADDGHFTEEEQEVIQNAIRKRSVPTGISINSIIADNSFQNGNNHSKGDDDGTS